MTSQQNRRLTVNELLKRAVEQLQLAGDAAAAVRLNEFRLEILPVQVIRPGRTRTTFHVPHLHQPPPPPAWNKERNIDDPKPVLKAGVIYSSDNGALICVHCAGASAKYTGHDISGQKCTALNMEDSKEWKAMTGEQLRCEGGCTCYS